MPCAIFYFYFLFLILISPCVFVGTETPGTELNLVGIQPPGNELNLAIKHSSIPLPLANGFFFCCLFVLSVAFPIPVTEHNNE